jgi:hypothetical protein
MRAEWVIGELETLGFQARVVSVRRLEDIGSSLEKQRGEGLRLNLLGGESDGR